VQIGLHHHREQRLVDPPVALQQRGKDRPGPQLRNPQLQIPGRRGESPRAGAVALGGPIFGAFVRAGADHRGQLRLDQRRIQRLGRRADAVIDVGNFQRLEQLEPGRLVQGHRGAFLFRVFLGGFTQKIHAVASRTPALRRRAQDLRPATPLPGTSPEPAVPAPCRTMPAGCPQDAHPMPPLTTSRPGEAAAQRLPYRQRRGQVVGRRNS
jgi:hypothetical protein